MRDTMDMQGKVRLLLEDRAGRLLLDRTHHNRIVRSGRQLVAQLFAGVEGTPPSKVTHMAVGTGKDPDVTKVADHMSESVISAAPDWSLEQAADEMVRRGIRHLVVVDRGELVGVLSMRDIVRCWTEVGATSSMSPP